MQASKNRFVEEICPRMFTPRRSLQIVAGASLLLSVIALGFLLHAARSVMLPLATAFVLSIVLAPLAVRLMRIGLPETVSAAILTLSTLALLIGVAAYAGKPAAEWVQKLPEIAERAKVRLSSVEKAINTVKEVTEEVDQIASMAEESPGPAPATLAEPKRLSKLVNSIPVMIVQILFTWVLLFFLLSSRSDFKRKFAAIHRTFSGRVRAVRIFKRIESQIGVYMLTMVVINTGLGIAMGVVAYVLGLPSPHVWGLLAALLNFIPYIGPFAMTALLALSSIANFEDPLMAAAPMLAFILLNFVESNLVTPMFLGVRMRITPLAIIISVSALSWLWGPVGGILAIPLLVILKTLCDLTPALTPIGVLIGELKQVPLGARNLGRRALAQRPV